MKYLIINADDLGASHGVNRGVFQAYHQGVLTSASLFVDRSGSEAAAALAREASSLSIGLHADLDGLASSAVRTSLLRQLARFEELLGTPPSHLDSHHHVHRTPAVLPAFLAVAEERGLVVRDFSPVRYIGEFYGQWRGATNLLQISVAGLTRILKTSLLDGLTELGCHPGYVDAGLVSSYSAEREAELHTLCDPSVRTIIQDLGVTLVSFCDVSRLVKELAIPGGPEQRP